MKAFNIKVNLNRKDTTLTILPQDGEYKIIYFGGIIGALKSTADHFKFVKPADVVPGSLPLYSYKQTDSNTTAPEFKLTAALLEQIIEAVENVVKSN